MPSGRPTSDRPGDALLRAVSERLNGLLRKGDIAARLGGDEFAILQTGASHPGEAELLARRIVREIAKPFSIDGHRITIGTSVGYALSPEHGDNLETLLARADEALCRIKSEGGGIAAYAPVKERERDEGRGPDGAVGEPQDAGAGARPVAVEDLEEGHAGPGH